MERRHFPLWLLVTLTAIVLFGAAMGGTFKRDGAPLTPRVVQGI